MDFESATKAAARLECTVRAVQKWAKEGKIPFAYKDGRDWKIPVNAVKPCDSEKETEFFTNEPYPIIHTYTTGKVMEYINSITDKDDYNMALCQYYYFKGELKESSIIAESYLDSKNPILCTTAAVFCIFANLCRGHLNKTRFAMEILEKEYAKNTKADTSNELKAMSVLSDQIIKMQLHLPIGHIQYIHKHMKYLDEGLKLFSCYLAAYKAYLSKDYSRSLGIVQTAINFSCNEYPIVSVYLYIIAAMNLINLMDKEQAKHCIERAWELASPDGFIMPFVEHYNLLQGLIEKHFKKQHPEDYAKIISFAKQYNTSWFEVYNQKNETPVASNLTHTEFTIAMLYSRNWKVKEIAEHMELSERTIMNYITFIYDKLQINGKKELEKFMLK